MTTSIGSMTRRSTLDGSARPWLGLTLIVACSCTVIRYVEPPPAPEPVVVEPREVDVLVLANLDPAVANLAWAYDEIVSQLGFAMAEHAISVRQIALSPLHRRVGEQVPLIGGSSDGQLLLAPLAEDFAVGEPAAFLVDPGRAEYDNLRQLGAALASTPLYDAVNGGGTSMGEAFYGPANDGLIAIVLNPLTPRCGQADCSAAAEAVADDFAAGHQAGVPAWLTLASGAPNGLHLIVVSSPEVSTHAALRRRCEGLPNFPLQTLDFMQGGGPPFHSVVASALVQRGVGATHLDFCEMLSAQAGELSLRVAGQVTFQQP